MWKQKEEQKRAFWFFLSTAKKNGYRVIFQNDIHKKPDVYFFTADQVRTMKTSSLPKKRTEKKKPFFTSLIAKRELEKTTRIPRDCVDGAGGDLFWGI